MSHWDIKYRCKSELLAWSKGAIIQVAFIYEVIIPAKSKKSELPYLPQAFLGHCERRLPQVFRFMVGKLMLCVCASVDRYGILIMAKDQQLKISRRNPKGQTAMQYIIETDSIIEATEADALCLARKLNSLFNLSFFRPHHAPAMF